LNELQKNLKIKIDFKQLNTQPRRDKAQVIQNEMQLIMRSNLYRDKFLKMLDEREYVNGELSKWKYASPNEIYYHVMSAREVLNPEEDNEVDIWVDDYYSFRRIIGFTSTKDKYIHTNTRYFDKRTSKLNGSNFHHEWGHKMGFSHDKRNTKRRKNSLCYLMNEIYEQCWDIMFSEPSANDKVLVCYRSWRNLWFKRCYWKYAGEV